MQAVESQTLILYHTDLRGQWPEAAATFAARLPYGRRLGLRDGTATGRASLAGIALAVRSLSRLLGRQVTPAEIAFAPGEKPRLAAGPDFSISHSHPWAGCAAVMSGRVGFDIEAGAGAVGGEWVVREALLKATGEGLRGLREARTLPVGAEPIRWRGELWQVQQLGQFADAAACIVSSHPAHTVDAHAIALERLFDP